MPEVKIIARIHTPYKTKFGIPRQSGVAQSVKGEIVFEPEFRNVDAVRGLEDFSHIWLIWQFSEAVRDNWSPLVRPPRLGGNKYLGVFATRSPFRPNSIGLSSVKLDRVEITSDKGPVLHVSGADLMDGTPIFDIKPYIPYADAHADAKGGFTDNTQFELLKVRIPDELKKSLSEGEFEALKEVLENDPRPRYHNDPERIYGMEFGGYEVKFSVLEDILTVKDIKEAAQ